MGVLILSASQVNSLTSITFTGVTAGALTVIDDIAGANTVDLSKITVQGNSFTYDLTSVAGTGQTNDQVGASGSNVVVQGGATVVAGVVGTSGVLPNVQTFAAADTKTGTANTNDAFVGTIAGLNGTTLTGNASDRDSLTLTSAGTFVLNNGGSGGTVTNITNLTLANGTNVVNFSGVSGIYVISGNAGADSVNLSNVGGNAIVRLGQGDDTLTLTGTAYNGTLDGGDGTSDTLNIVNNSNLAAAKVQGFEGLFITANALATLTADQYKAFLQITGATGTETLTFSTAGTLTGTASIEGYVLANGTNQITLGTASTVTGGTGVDTLVFSADVSGTAAAYSTNLTNVENLVFQTAVGTTVTGVSAAVQSITANGGTFQLSGTQSFTAAAGTNDVTAVAASVNQITLGAGTDIVRASGSVYSAIDTVANFKAAGSDSFKTGTGASSLTTLTVSTATSATLAAAIEAAAAAAGQSLASTAQAFTITVQSGDAAGTYAFQNIGGTGTQVDSSDFIVKLTGTVGTITAADFSV
ncbi:MAG: beta strand repeat-containing protein [Elstera sp.]